MRTVFRYRLSIFRMVPRSWVRLVRGGSRSWVCGRIVIILWWRGLNRRIMWISRSRAIAAAVRVIRMVRGPVRRRMPTGTRRGSLRLAAADARVRLLGAVWDQDQLDQLYGNALTYVHGHSVGGTNPSLLRAMGAGAATSAFDVSFKP